MIPRGFRLCATVFQSFQARPLSTTSRTRVRFAVSAALLITQSIACVLDYVCAAAPHSQQTCHQALLLLLALVAVLLCPPPVPVFLFGAAVCVREILDPYQFVLAQMLHTIRAIAVPSCWRTFLVIPHAMDM